MQRRSLLTMNQEATSLGGVESLIEYRLNSDPNEDPLLVRLSIGVEDVEVCDIRSGSSLSHTIYRT